MNAWSRKCRNFMSANFPADLWWWATICLPLRQASVRHHLRYLAIVACSQIASALRCPLKVLCLKTLARQQHSMARQNWIRCRTHWSNSLEWDFILSNRPDALWDLKSKRREGMGCWTISNNGTVQRIGLAPCRIVAAMADGRFDDLSLDST